MYMLELIGTGLVQWDLDVQMRITTDQKVDEVHFANIGDAVALVVKPKTNNGETIVDVPNILLQTSRNLMAYVLADGRTIRRISFGIESKPKPEGYAYKETEILNYRTLEERIQILEKNVGGGTASITVDSALDKTSTNPVQNKAVAEAVEKLSNNKLEKTELPEAVNTALAQAKESGEFDGADGTTPHIGENGNWFIGDEDTGVNAEGKDGYTPQKGIDYFDGKTPEKGVDYFTEADKTAFVEDVLNALPTWEGGAY